VQATTTVARAAGGDFQSPTANSVRLGIPTVADRVCQQATKIVLEPLFEADFFGLLVWVRPQCGRPPSYGGDASRLHQGNEFVFEADIENFFGSIDHERLLNLVARRVSDRRVLKFGQAVAASRGIGRWSRHRDGHGDAPRRCHSPLLANIYLKRIRSGPGRNMASGSSLYAMRTSLWPDHRNRPTKPKGERPGHLGGLGLGPSIRRDPVWSTSDRGREGF